MFAWLWLFIYGILSTAASYEGLAITIPEEIKIDSIALELQLHDNNTSTTLSKDIKFNTNGNNPLRRSFRGDHPEKFTDFIKAVIELLIKYNDDDLEKFFTTFNEEVSKYHYNGCKFYELTDNDAFRNFIARKFDEVKNIPALVIRKRLLKISNQIDDAKYGIYEKELIDYINLLYKQDSVKKFNKFLLHLKAYTLKTKKDLDLVKIVRDGMRSLIFNHYTNLDYNTRAAIKFKLLSYWQYYIASEPSLRSQLNPMERQLLGNLDEDAGILYHTKDNRYEANNMKYSKFLPHYPNLVLDSKIMISPPVKPTWQAYKTTPTSEFITYYQYFDDTHTEINVGINTETMVTYHKPITDEIFKQATDDSNEYDEYNTPYATTDRHEVRAVTEENHISTRDMYNFASEQNLSKGKEVIKRKHKHKTPFFPKSEDSKHTEGSIASLYTIYLPDQITDTSLMSEIKDVPKEPKSFRQKNNIKHSKILPHNTNLDLESKIMNSPPVKPTRQAYKTTPRSTSESIAYITYNQDLDDIHTEINVGINSEPKVTHHIPMTEQIFEQVTDDPNEYDEYNNHYKTTDMHKVRAGTGENYISTRDMHDFASEQYPSKGKEVIKSKHKHKTPSFPKRKVSKNKEGSIASLYTIYLPDQITDTSLMSEKRDALKESKSLRQKKKKHETKELTTLLKAKQTTNNKLTSTQTSQTHAFIEVVTMRPLVSKKVTTFKHITYEINIKNSTSDARRQLKKQTIEYPSKIKNTFLKDDAAAAYNDLSVQKFSQDSLRASGKKYDRQLTTDTIILDKALFNRLQNLERELSKVKTIVKNDTETIKELKHNIQFEDKIKPKMGKEHILAKDEHFKYASGETKSPFLEKLKSYYDENEKDQPMENLHNRRYMDSDKRHEVNRRKHAFDTNNFDIPYIKPVLNEMVNEQDGFSKDNIKRKDERSYQSDIERGVLLRLARLQQKKNDEIANTFDSNEYKHNNERYSRRAMINKVKEIKNKFDRARKETEDYKIMDSLSADANMDFDKEYIPNKESFNTNMKDLEDYLNLMIPKKM